MYTAISILIIIASILITIIVLVQNSKGGGLAANFASGNNAFGVRQTADFLEKATWFLAVFIIVLCVAASGLTAGGKSDGEAHVKDALEQQSTQQGNPAFPTSVPSTDNQDNQEPQQ